MIIQVKRLSDGKVFTSDLYKDEIISIDFEEYCIKVIVIEGDRDWGKVKRELICMKHNIELDEELQQGQEFGRIL